MKLARFSRDSLPFLVKAARQKREDWLDRHQEDYERLLLNPFRQLASSLKSELADFAPGYNFPQKGIGRIKRSANRATEEGWFRDWMHYSAARPRVSRFETNPNLYFLINPDDRTDPVLIAGGLYMPSSRQLRSIREAIANDASPFDTLFKSRSFSDHFKGGFSSERTASRPPRGFDPAHTRMNWLKLQAYFVWKPYSMKEFTSKDFHQIVVKDCKQILRLNELLEHAISGKLQSLNPGLETRPAVNLDTIQAPTREMDF